MRIAVVGTGYVGLVSGACFAELGHSVVCVDSDAKKVAALRRGEIGIHEPGLADIVGRAVTAGRLSFALTAREAVPGADIVFIAVGTPSDENGDADLRHVRAAAGGIAAALTGYAVIAVKSTVPLGTGDEIERIIREVNPRAEFSIVSNPEFLREGAAVLDFQYPERIVVGTDDERGRTVMRTLYREYAEAGVRVLEVSRRTAELTKYAANSFLAMKLAFINEIANLCEAAGADVEDVAAGIGLDSRIGAKFLKAGPGFGGSCFPKDMQALARTGIRHGTPLELVETTIRVNEQRFIDMADKISAACGGDVRGKRVAILGLTFKPDTDDVRGAPAIAIIRELRARGATVAAYDPAGMEGAAAVLDGIAFAPDPYAAAAGADVIAIVTEWDMFRALDLDRIGSLMNTPVLVDMRNIYGRTQMARRGFTYSGVGRA